MLASMAEREQTRTLSRANIQQFPDIPAISVDFLARRGRESKKEGGLPCAVACGAVLLGFGSVGFEIRLLRVSGLTVRKIAFQMLKA